MSVSLFHKCLECGKQVADGQRGLMHHYDGANPIKVTDCCDAMTARAASHTIQEILQMKKLEGKDLDKLFAARKARQQVREAAAKAGRTLNEAGSPFHVE